LIEFYDDSGMLRESQDTEDESSEAPFPLLLPRGHLELFERAAERLLSSAFGNGLHTFRSDCQGPDSARTRLSLAREVEVSQREVTEKSA
jgi:hypothetical protein